MAHNKSNPFDFAETAATAQPGTRKLDYTPRLIDLADTRAHDLILKVSKTPELHTVANKALDSGETLDCIDLINAVYDNAQILTDTKVLDGCPDDQLARLLESRRSDRSKTAAKGLRTSIQITKNWISCMYAELLIRQAMGKPYNGPTHELDTSDLEAVGRKIKSLQSKKSRLGKLAEFDSDAAQELEAVEAEIARLNELRPGTRVSAKTVVKDMTVNQIRELVKNIDPSTLPAEEQAKLQELIAKLG